MKIQHSAILLGFAAPSLRAGLLSAQQYDYSYQLYQEDNDRMQIESHYVRAKVDITDDTQIRFQYLNDTISGASPTGVLPGNVQPFLANVEDLRQGFLGALSQRIANHRVEVELSHSEENDYDSKGLALSDAIELNQKNTVLSFGFNYLDDNVKVPGLGDHRKESYDGFLGASQLINKNTTLTANLTLGWSNGYLNDPYKVVQRNEVVTTPDTIIPVGDGTNITIPGIAVPVVAIYRENRPKERYKQTLQLEGKHYFEAESATAEIIARFSHDDYGIVSEMLNFEWRQDIGSRLQLSPFVRFYHQSAADFYVTTLNDLDIGTPSAAPNGTGPYYSADYRLSSLDATSMGLRMKVQVGENLSFNATYEHYTMKGSGSDVAPDAMYPSANMLTVGMTLNF